MTEYLLTFLAGFVGSAVSAMAGAGSGLITSPYLILIGLPPQVAVATAKLGGVGLTLGSLEKFRKTKDIRWEFVVPFIITSLIAGVAGAGLLLALQAETVRYIVASGVLIALPLLFIRGLGLERQETSPKKRKVGYVFNFGTETVQAAFGSGLGILTSIVVMFFFGMTALQASATKRLPGLVKEVIVLPAFIVAGIIAYPQGIVLLLGSLLGGFIGAGIAIKRGNTFVKIMLAAVAAAMAIKLLLS